MVTNTRQIKITADALLDVTCEEWLAGGKLHRNTYGQVARGRAFGTWGSVPNDQAEPTIEQIAKAVSDAMRDSLVVVRLVEFDGGCDGESDWRSPIFHFAEATPNA